MCAVLCHCVQQELTKPESESNSTSIQAAPEASEFQENLSELNDVVMNHATSQVHLTLNTSSASDFSISLQSATDLPSLIDHCLTDSVAEEIGLMKSPMRTESADDNDSALSTPPLHPDSDNDAVLPANECYANGIFPDKIDNLFVSRSPSTDQLQLSSLLDNCSEVPIGDSDAISKQLYMDVNNLLLLTEGNAQKTEDEGRNGEGTACDESDSSTYDTILPDTAVSFEDMTGVAGRCEITSKVASSVKPNTGNADAVVNENCDASSPFPFRLDECLTDLSFDCDRESANSSHPVAQSGGEMEPESDLLAGDNTAYAINGSCDVDKITPKTEDIEPAVSDVLCDNSKTYAKFVTNSASSAPVDCDESSALLPSDDKVNLVRDIKDSGQLDVGWLSLSDSICKKEETRNDKSDDCKRFPSIAISECTTTADFNTTSLWNTDDSGAFGSLALKVARTTSMPCVASFSSSSSDGWPCNESFSEAWPPDWKLETNAMVKLKRLVLPVDQYFQPSNYTASTEKKSTSSKQHFQSGHTSTSSKLASIQPLLSKMTSGEVLKLTESKSPTTELPVEAPLDVSERSASSAPVEAPLDVSERSASSALVESALDISERSASSAPVEAPLDVPERSASSAPVESALDISERSASSSPVEAALDVSERSASSAVMRDLAAKQPSQGKHINELPSSASVRDVVSTPSSSSLDVKQPSAVVASKPVQKKHFSYMDYCNTPKYQPVVRLVRLPLEFFHMLQQMPQPSASASSSVSVSDLSKRFITLH